MKAAFLHTTGKPDVIQYGELPDPEPNAGEIRIRVGASSVNPIDTYIRAGLVAMKLPLPFIPGCDFAGTVDRVGAGVTRFRIGDRVWGSNQGLLGRQGTMAELICVEEKWAYPSPANANDTHLAAMSLVGITAHLGLFFRTNLKAGETVFINGGTGGVGSMAVQMAKAIGAKVVTTVGSDEKAEMAKKLGADCVLNYKTDDVPAGVKKFTDGRGVDVWYETQPPTDLDRTIDLMASFGRIVLMAGRAARPLLPNGPFYVKGLQLIGFAMFNCSAEMQRASATQMSEWIQAGKLRSVIGRTVSLKEAAFAHQLQEENTLQKSGTLSGKIAMVIG